VQSGTVECPPLRMVLHTVKQAIDRSNVADRSYKDLIFHAKDQGEKCRTI
jgi:hypothetical protein